MVHHTIRISSAKAPKASSRSRPIAVHLLRRHHAGRVSAAWGAILGLLAGCATAPLPESVPVAERMAAAPAAKAPERARKLLQRERARWVEADWSELPGWGNDRLTELWPALLQGCARPAPGWAETCARASLADADTAGDARAWLMRYLQPYRVEALDGQAEGLITGYYEPQFDAQRRPAGGYRVPLHAAPPDLKTRRPYFTRKQLETEEAPRLRALAFLEDPIDALLLQIQGSGRLRITEPDGRQRLARFSFAGHNEQPYQSIGKLLIEQGELRAHEASWAGIKDWGRRNPQRLAELLWNNPRYVFFREEPIARPELGPRGAQGVPLTPGRSIAVDPASIPYGTPVWLDATEPLSSQPLQRLVMAQDTGSAISGALRADLFWGWGAEAEQQAGRMKQALRAWVLWPRTMQDLDRPPAP